MLFIQGNNENEWFKAYPWQNIFLKEDSFNLTKTHYHHSGDAVYVNIPISTEENIVCENLKETARITGLFEIEKFKSKPWIEWMWCWISSSTEKNYHQEQIISAGFLCNLTTGTSRMYVVINGEVEQQVLNSLKHNKVNVLSTKSLEEYRKNYEDIMFG
jgi:hypothetical protein